MHRVDDGVNFPAHWADNGCSVAPSCLACPLPRCRYDVVGGVRTLRNRVRDPEIVRRYQAGERAEAIAADLGVTHRTVYRIISAGRRAA